MQIERRRVHDFSVFFGQSATTSSDGQAAGRN